MSKYFLFIIIPMCVYSIDIQEFYNFAPGTMWIYEEEGTDSGMTATGLKESVFLKSTITLTLDTVISIDTLWTFIFARKDSIYKRTTGLHGSGNVKDTTYMMHQQDTTSLVIKGNTSYCLCNSHYVSPFFCPYLPLCANVSDTISDTIGNFFSRNDTLFYSRSNDDAYELWYSNYREWSVSTGCNASYSRTWYTDNVVTVRTNLISFREPTVKIKIVRNTLPARHVKKVTHSIHLLKTPQFSCGYYIIHQGRVYNLNGQMVTPLLNERMRLVTKKPE